MKHVNRNANRTRRARTQNRWTTRVRIGLVPACALGAFVAGVAVIHEVKPPTSARRSVAVADEQPINCGPCSPAAEPGHDKRHVMRINVSTHSTANAVGPSHGDPGSGSALSFGSPASVYDFLAGVPNGVNDYVLAGTDQSFRLENCIEGRLRAPGEVVVSEITDYGAGLPRRQRWITDATARRLNCGWNADRARLDKIINPAATAETAIETHGVLVFPCRCKRRPPRRGSKAIRLARRSCPMK